MTADFSDYIVYVDESGDHGLLSLDPNYPIFVLAFCIFRKDTYINRISPSIQEFKFKHYGHEHIILHEHDIRKEKGIFSNLKTPQLKADFLSEISEIIKATDFTLIACVILKDKLIKNMLNQITLIISLSRTGSNVFIDF